MREYRNLNNGAVIIIDSELKSPIWEEVLHEPLPSSCEEETKEPVKKAPRKKATKK